MKADHRQTSSGNEALGVCGQGLVERSELVVHRDSQSLKCTCGRIDAPRVCRAWHGATNDFGQLLCRLDSLFLSFLDDSPRDAAAKSLFAKLIDNVGQVVLAQAVHQVAGRFAFLGIES